MSSQEQSLPADSKQTDEAVELASAEKEKPIAVTAEYVAAVAASEDANILYSSTSAANTSSELQPSSAAKAAEDNGTTVEASGSAKAVPEIATAVDTHSLDKDASKGESVSAEKSSVDDTTVKATAVKGAATEEEPSIDDAGSPNQRSGAVPTADDATATSNVPNANTEKSAPNTRPSTSRSAAAGSNTDSISVNVEGDDNPANVVQIERPRVQVYGSTVSGNRTYKRQAKDLFMMLEANEIDFEFICIAADEKAKNYMRRKSRNNMTIPQIYVDAEFKGFYDDAFKANEIDELYEWLGLDEEPLEY
ncbi:hypothetical protein H4R20_003371 [Coemansia guatemalensis]|uniref:Glutaredoxin domain-containing protein n=1 Tax=Coemansia guatemalensis TaxID=2761395 RepID=A0A9W8LT39_9FUNG|nr:hypothetical protein H4R20_003371 [Coemansia guatemalensis]